MQAPPPPSAQPTRGSILLSCFPPLHTTPSRSRPRLPCFLVLPRHRRACARSSPPFRKARTVRAGGYYRRPQTSAVAPMRSERRQRKTPLSRRVLLHSDRAIPPQLTSLPCPCHTAASP